MSERPALRRPVWTAAWAVPAVIAIAYLAVGVVTRLALASHAGHTDGLARVLLVGAGRDLRTLVWLWLPALLALAFVPGRWFTGRARRLLVAGLVGGALWLMLFTAMAEWFFFDEFQARFNLVAVDYLRYPHEVFVTVADSYPLWPVLVGVTLVALLVERLLWPVVAAHLTATPRAVRLGTLAANGALAGALVLLPPGADAGGDRLTRELSANGVTSFVTALATNELDYHRWYREVAPERAAALVSAEFAVGGAAAVRAADGTLAQRVAARADGLGPLDVVLIVEESLGAAHIGALGDQRGLTPAFDALAQEGLFFTSAYATGTRTVRGLEAINLSLPPVPGESVLKRPDSAALLSLGEVLAAHGYRSSFLYGGYAYFDGMRDFFAGNGATVIDRAAIDAPRFANVWGVSDEDLFDAALAHLDAEAARPGPAFVTILTTSNHKPFTFPSGVSGVPPEGGGRKAGVRYADHALGRFMRSARTRPWARDTLFVILGDHGPRVYGAAEIPVPSYHIPVLFHAPGRIAPRREPTPMSQVDVAPTLLGLLGLGWEAPFYGRDVLHHPDPARPLFLQHNYSVGLLAGARLAVLGFRHEARVLDYDATHERYAPTQDDPALLDRATALYQTAYDLHRVTRAAGD